MILTAQVAQLAELLTCNERVEGSIPFLGFFDNLIFWTGTQVVNGDRL